MDNAVETEHAELAPYTLWMEGYRATGGGSPGNIPLHIGWELVGVAANDAGRTVYGFSQADMKVLVLGGQVAQLPTSAAEKSKA